MSTCEPSLRTILSNNVLILDQNNETNIDRYVEKVIQNIEKKETQCQDIFSLLKNPNKYKH